MNTRALSIVYAMAILAITFVLDHYDAPDGWALGVAFFLMVAAIVHLRRSCRECRDDTGVA